MKRWYVVQIYAGYETALVADLERRIKQAGLEELFGQILVPSVQAQKAFGAASTQGEQQLFPGYLLIEMVPEQEAIRLVQASPRVVRFLGGKNPTPISQQEVDRVLSQLKGEVIVAPKASNFVEGSEIEINEGPFAGFVGIIESVDDEHERITVMVSIFGRMTPVDLGFNQVKQ
ncbi:MAG: transcription termination/antitermination protein NusG [Candidatus Babeliales bacterium]